MRHGRRVRALAARRRRTVVLLASSLLTVAALGAVGVATTTAGATHHRAATAVIRIEPGIIHPVGIQPAAGLDDGPPTTASCEAQFDIACYSPIQLQAAYGLKPLFAKGVDGAGQTIVIVDAYGSPTIQSDLGVFDQTFGIPAPPSLTVIQPAGPVAPYVETANREGWAGETTLDVEYAHAMAPGAAILLVETPKSENEGTSGFPQIVEAETYVIDHHLGGVISQSFSATEQTFPSVASVTALRSATSTRPARASRYWPPSGDSGAADVGHNGHTYYDFPVTSWPDSDPLVTGVGGTQLHLTASGHRTSPDTVWNDTYDVATQNTSRGSPGPVRWPAGAGSRSSSPDRRSRTVWPRWWGTSVGCPTSP